MTYFFVLDNLFIKPKIMNFKVNMNYVLLHSLLEGVQRGTNRPSIDDLHGPNVMTSCLSHTCLAHTRIQANLVG